jgi:hypothetical protein
MARKKFEHLPDVSAKHNEIHRRAYETPYETPYGSFVHRGDVASVDYSKTDLTTDGSWNDLDMSSIVPSDAKCVLLRVSLKDDATGKYIIFRADGNEGGNQGGIRTQVANVTIQQNVLTPIIDGIVEYSCSNTTFTAISIVVVGWWV